MKKGYFKALLLHGSNKSTNSICLNPDVQRNTIMEFQKIKNLLGESSEKLKQQDTE